MSKILHIESRIKKSVTLFCLFILGIEIDQNLRAKCKLHNEVHITDLQNSENLLKTQGLKSDQKRER